MDTNKYLESLASASYTPGGGSAICLTTKIGIALILKAINITMNRKSFAEKSDDVKEIFEKHKNLLVTAMEEYDNVEKADQDAFNKFMIAYKSKDENNLKLATLTCFEVPQSGFDMIYILYNLSSILEPHIVDSIMPDYVIGKKILNVCMEGFLETMKANISNYPDLEKRYNEAKEKYGKLQG